VREKEPVTLTLLIPIKMMTTTTTTTMTTLTSFSLPLIKNTFGDKTQLILGGDFNASIGK